MMTIHTGKLAGVAALALLMGTSLSGCAEADAQASVSSYAEDRALIEDLNGRYLFAIDWADAESYANTFAEDGVLNWGGGDIVGREAIAGFIGDGRARREEARANATPDNRPPVGRHFITNTVIEIDGDTAHQVAYWTHMTSDETGYGTVDFFGHYEDDLVKVDGEWLYARRHIYNQAIPEWEGSLDNPVTHVNPPPREREPSGE